MDRKYIAGFFDGEGSALIITVRRILPDGRISYQFRPTISIAQKTIPILEEIKSYLGYGEIQKSDISSNKWIVKNRIGCIEFVNKISPYVILKKEQLLIVKQMCVLIPRSNMPYSKEQFMTLLNMRDMIFKLNCLTRSNIIQKYNKAKILSEHFFINDIKKFIIDRQARGQKTWAERKNNERCKKNNRVV